jgi:hypothetical protein
MIFRNTIVTTGHVVTTPSGNVHRIRHVQLTRRDLRVQVTEAMVIDNLPCQIRDRGTRDSHLVVTPALSVQFTCHITPA